jgi:hypothetical protein
MGTCTWRDSVRSLFMANEALSWLLHHRWNFRVVPSETDLVTYLSVVLTCARGDRSPGTVERTWALGYGAALGLTDASLATLRNATETPSDEVIATAARCFGARAMLYDAIACCDADHEYTASEAKTIRRIATVLHVSEASVAQIEAVYLQEKAVRARRLELALSDREG